MAQPKAQTLQQRFGFVDNDLKTINHDEMMMWLDAQAELVAKRIVGWVDGWKPEQIEKFRQVADRLVTEQIETEARLHKSSVALVEAAQDTDLSGWRELNSNAAEFHWKNLSLLRGWAGLGDPPEKAFRIRTKWEQAIKSDKFIVGFIDMRVTYEHKVLGLAHVEPDSYQPGTFNLPKKFHEQGLPEFKVFDDNEVDICFEVKTAIPSLGELLRQINLYRTYYAQAHYYIVSPNDQFVRQLTSQGIGFVKYPSGEVFKAMTAD